MIAEIEFIIQNWNFTGPNGTTSTPACFKSLIYFLDKLPCTDSIIKKRIFTPYSAFSNQDILDLLSYIIMTDNIIFQMNMMLCGL